MALLVVALVAVFLALWTDDLFQRSTLFRPDEGRYAEIPREMVASGDRVTPRLNDLNTLSEKPLPAVLDDGRHVPGVSASMPWARACGQCCSAWVGS
ncbi:hypothetical protein ACU4HD_43415 [Cupriavidus basilensis]